MFQFIIISKKNYKVKLLTSLILKKIKSTKKILEKIIKKQQEKNYAGKHCNNLQCFMKKSTAVILNQFNIKNNKINKDNLKKIITKKKSCVGILQQFTVF